MNYVALFVGGGLGSVCRFWLSRHNHTTFTVLPLGTMAANALACLVLGYVAAMLAQKPENAAWVKPFFAIGFCGGFSTFSTFSLEVFELARQDMHMHAFLNVAISLVVCLMAIYAGFELYRFAN